jgi:adenylate cyclase
VGLGAAFLVAALLAAAGLWQLAGTRAREASTAKPGAFTVSGFGDRPAVAVLPFENLSPEPDEEYFADGLAEDLITRLSLWRSFPVIARNSSFVYKGKPVDTKQVSAELGVRYVVEGSVRRAGDRVRVSAQLIDAPTGEHVWAETYDRKVTDLFALQDEISTAIAAPLVGDLERAEQTRALERDPQNLEAWGLYQRATRAVGEGSREANAEAEKLLERALAIDPGFASAWGRLAVAHAMRLIWGWTDDRDATAAAGLSSARKAVELDPGNPLAQCALGMVTALTGDSDTSIRASRRAVELNPSMPEALDALGFSLSFIQGSNEGIEVLERAIRLGPSEPLTWVYLDNLSGAYFLAGRYAEGLDAAKRVVEARPKYYWGYLDLALNRTGLGELDAARAAIQRGRETDPTLSLEAIRRSGASPANIEKMSDALAKAGLE